MEDKVQEQDLPQRVAKQIIVVRTDLKMRRGKEAAQVAHASIKFLAEALHNAISLPWPHKGRYVQDHLTNAALQWLNGSFTKIVVGVDTLAELIEIGHQAHLAGLTNRQVIDSGKTEFGGFPTYTCVAIGPNWAEDIDKITGHLKLR